GVLPSGGSVTSVAEATTNTGDRVYTIVFGGTLANTTTPLQVVNNTVVGTGNNGQLTGNANFSVESFNNPSVTSAVLTTGVTPVLLTPAGEFPSVGTMSATPATAQTTGGGAAATVTVTQTGGTNTSQIDTLQIVATTGTFTVSVAGFGTTAALPYNVS